MTDTSNQERRETVRKLMVQTPYIGGLGIEIVDWSENWAKLRLPFHERLTNDGRVYHGGVVASLVDTAGAAAAWSGHDFSKGTKASTVSMTVNYLSAADRSDLMAEARAIKRGKELIFTTIEVTDVNEKQIASAVLTYRIAL
ncbi:MAG: thioesterase [Acidobacteria bacterium]|nr:MAG: thioesterase [Acidobacteriota bacterium]